MVNRSVIDEEITRRIWNERFQLISDWDDQPIFFQYIFSKNGETFRYGFEILKDTVNCEWLFQTGDEEEKELFFRNKTELKINSGPISMVVWKNLGMGPSVGAMSYIGGIPFSLLLQHWPVTALPG